MTDDHYGKTIILNENVQYVGKEPWVPDPIELAKIELLTAIWWHRQCQQHYDKT